MAGSTNGPVGEDDIWAVRLDLKTAERPTPTEVKLADLLIDDVASVLQPMLLNSFAVALVGGSD